jgi:NADH-quinone oxidoreductase subunit N
MGFVLLGFLSTRSGVDPYLTALGVGNAFYYVIIYAIMTLASFGVVLAMSSVGFEADQIEDFKGLNQRNPWLAFLIMLVMFSLAGIPPLVGFMAKFVVIQGLVNAGLFKLALVAVLFSLIGAFYYLRVVKTMYFDKADNATPIEFSAVQHGVLTVNALVLVLLGVLPDGLIRMAVNAVLKTLGAL